MAHTTLPKFASNVPKITKLRNSINYGEDRKPLGPKFWKHLQVFREYYKTASGTEGSEFVKWKNQEHKIALSTMVEEYLDYRGNGVLFWPDDSTAPEYNSLRYSMHHEYIKSILIQIIFRLNNQQYSNDRYRSKRGSRLSDNDTSSNRENSSLAAEDSTPADEHSTYRKSVSTSHEPYFQLDSSHGSGIPLANLGPGLSGTGETFEDPYQVPDSPHAASPNGGCSSRPRGLANNEVTSSTARQRAQKKSRTKGVSRSRGTKRRANEDAQIFRNPHRLRKRPRLPDMASQEEIEEACSPRPSTEMSDGVVNETNIQRTLPPQQPTSSQDEEESAGEALQDQSGPALQHNASTSATEAPQPHLEGTGGLDHSSLATQKPSELSAHAAEHHDTADHFAAATGSLRVDANRAAESNTFGSASRTASPSAVPSTNAHILPTATHWESNEATPSSEQRAGASSVDAIFGQTPAPLADMGQSSEGQVEEPFLKLSTIPEDGTLENSPSENPVPITESIELNNHQLQLNDEPGMADIQSQGLGSEYPLHQAQGERNSFFAQDTSLGATDRLSRRCRTLPPETSSVRDHKEPKLWHGSQSPKKSSPTDTEPSKQEPRKSNVSIAFVLVLARYPKWRGQEWTPEGRFSQKSLPQLMNELPAGFSNDAPGLIFRLKGPGFRTEDPVLHGENDTFDAMQESFARHIRKNVREHKGNPVSFRIEIEALEEGYLLKPGDCMDDVDDGDF